jgi:hypothetical protein
VKTLPEVFRVEHGKFVIYPAAASEERAKAAAVCAVSFLHACFVTEPMREVKTETRRTTTAMRGTGSLACW